MKRKAIRLSRQTLVLSLPAKWVRSNNIDKGDELDVQVNDQDLVVRASERKARRGISSSINLSNLHERTVRWILSGLQKQGVDEINVTYDSPSHLPIVSDVTKNLFVGMALVRQGPKGATIKSLAVDDPSTFDQTLRRAFQVTLTMGDSLYAAIKDGDLDSIEGIKELEKTNNQLTNFCQRLLNSGTVASSQKNHFLYTICWNLEKIADDYKYICDHLSRHPHEVPPMLVGHLHTVNDFLRGYYELFYSFSVEKLDALAKQKDALHSESLGLIQDHAHPEHVIAVHLHNLFMKTLDFSTSMYCYHTG